VSPLGWAGFAVVDLALAGGGVLLGRHVWRWWREAGRLLDEILTERDDDDA
jgi:hypothetical protein